MHIQAILYGLMDVIFLKYMIAEGLFRGDMWEIEGGNGNGYIQISLYVGVNSHKEKSRKITI